MSAKTETTKSAVAKTFPKLCAQHQAGETPPQKIRGQKCVNRFCVKTRDCHSRVHGAKPSQLASAPRLAGGGRH